MSIKLAVNLSDTHFGSTVGLWPPDFVSEEDVPIGQSDFQKWLWECWVDLHTKALPKYIGNDPYALFLNGDSIEGEHHRTVQLMSANLHDQVRASELALKPIAAKAKKIYVIKGTEVHTRTSEIHLGEALKAQRDPTTGQYAFDKLKIEIHGCPVIYRHHMPASIRPYLEASALSIELGSERISASRVDQTVPRVLCCAHRHKHGIFKDIGGMTCVTSGWQGLTRHGYKVVPSADVTTPTCIVLDWRGREFGELPHAEDFTYQPAPTPYLKI